MINLPSIIDAVLEAVKKHLDKNPPDVHRYMEYVSADSIANRHIVLTSGGTQLTGVMAYQHVTGLTAGDIVEVIHPGQGKTMTIVGRL